VKEVTYSCPKDCFWVRNGSWSECSTVKDIKRLGIDFKRNHLTGLQVLINVKNIGEENRWYIGAKDVVLVDEQGFTYRGEILCKECLPYRISPEGTYVLPQTQADYIQIFSIPNSEIAKVRVVIDSDNSWIDFAMNDNIHQNPFDDSSAMPVSSQKDSAYERYIYEEHLRNRWISQRCFMDRVNKLKTNIYSRFNNTLTETQKLNLDNKIKTDLYNINLDLHSESDESLNEIIEIVRILEEEYNRTLEIKNETEIARKTINKRIDELLELSPREFEEYIGELFNSLGYKVEVTQYSNDQGLDIVMYKDLVKYGVQCKRYKGTVGSPEIQRFIGALNHANADKGYFVTTGIFSFEAEKMAMQHPIQLINKIDLAQLIINALEAK
jgi:restriction system protein